MSGLAMMEMQHALYTKLHGDGVLMGMVSGVYDVVPQQVVLPYVVIGDGAQQVVPTDSAALTECRLTLHVWTDTGGRKSALTIMNRLYALLHLGTMTLSGYQLVLLRCEQAETLLTEQGTRVQGSLTVLATVAEA